MEQMVAPFPAEAVGLGARWQTSTEVTVNGDTKAQNNQSVQVDLTSVTAGTITRASGLQYQVLRSGVGRRPGRSDVVRLQYAMRLINGTVVDATTPSLPAAVLLGGISLAGLGEALSLMREGDRWQVVIPPNLGFGAATAVGGAVPPGQALVMDLTLVSAVAPRAGEAPTPNPFSLWGNGHMSGAALTIRP